jgi:hypothetical protein
MSRLSIRLALSGCVMASLWIVGTWLGGCAPSPTATPLPGRTPVPIATLTPAPTPSRPPEAVATLTPAPTPSRSPEVVATDTPAPTPSRSPEAVATDTPAPTPSPTSEPVTVPAVPPGTVSTPADLGCLVYGGQGDGEPVWLLKGGEPPRLLAHGDWPTISPDGRYVVYDRGFPTELWIIATDGSNEQLLYRASEGGPGPSISGRVWAPDGTMLAVGTTCPGCPASQDAGDLWRLDVPTGAVRQLAEKGADFPLFSPDSRWLAVMRPLGLMISPSGSVGLIDVEGRGDVALFELLGVRDRAWAADSSGFVVALDESGPNPSQTGLWWVPTNGSPAQIGRLRGVVELAWQPGGERLAYRQDAGGGVTRLVLASRDGSGEVPIPGTEGLYLVVSQLRPSPWSPDGRWLLAGQDQTLSFVLVDTHGPSLHPLDAQVVYGWLDAGHYLASFMQGEELEQFYQGGDMEVPVYRCAPLGGCEFLTRVSRSPILSYAAECR